MAEALGYDEVLQTLASWESRPVLVTVGSIDESSYAINLRGRLGNRRRSELPDLPTSDNYDVGQATLLLHPEEFREARLEPDLLSGRSGDQKLVVHEGTLVISIGRMPR